MNKQSQAIQNMFSEIAPHYDRVNSVLSLGIHHLWKKKLVSLSQLKSGQAVLDCATGTGDLALRYKDKVGTDGRVVGTDFCKEMIDLAPEKAKAAGMDISFEIADACNLQYTENEFDCTSISFGIRNVEDTKAALKELSRVTRPTGKVMILEFGQVKVPVVGQAYNFYSNVVLPKVGGLISGKPSAYKYLNDSSQEFPCGQDFVDLAMSTGAYEKVEYWPLSLGVAYIYRMQPKKN